MRCKCAQYSYSFLHKTARVWFFSVILSVFGLIRGCSAQTITFWHPWSQGRGVVQSLASDYSRQTGVRVQVRAFNSRTYNPWGGGSQPDIIGLSYPSRGTIAANARRGRLYNMAGHIQQAWYADLWPGPVAVFELRGTEAPRGQPGIYGLPLTGYVKVFIYNRTLFRRAGVGPPRTWSDFLLAASKLRRLGVVPLAGGFDGTYPAFPLIYERSYLGTHYLLETYYNRYPYSGSRWRNLFRIYEEIRRYGLTTPSAAQMSRSTSEKYFLNGGSAIILDGPWFDSIRRSYAPRFSDWDIFTPPIDTRASFVPAAPGGVAEGVVINALSRNKSASVRFLRWMTEPAQQVRLANSMGSLPISERSSRSSALQGYLRAFAPHMRYAALDIRYYESPAILGRLYTGTRNVIRGTETPDQVLNATQRMSR